MIEIKQHKQLHPHQLSHFTDKKQPSTATTPSPNSKSPLNPEEAKKKKSQLCRQFMEYGYCPYQKRCKFAHGSHQLRRDHQLNIKYKTKECEHFTLKWCCMYGNRCNFIHQCAPVRQCLYPDRTDILLNLAYRQPVRQSRLLRLLSGFNK